MANEHDPFDPHFDQVADDKQAAAEDSNETAFRSDLENLRAAYIRVFKEGTPSREDRDLVMHDLELFTRGERTPWHADERVHCVFVGRHEVYTRIKHHITLSLDALMVDRLQNAKVKG